jgi:Abi-like protein
LTKLVISTLSHRRFETYHIAAGHNAERALALYLWNAKLGASFHVPIQAVEVSLRNRVNQALTTEFGQHWWRNGRFNSIIDRERIRDLETVKSRITRKRMRLETDKIVAGLSFGFWVGMLQPKYNPPIWGEHLRPSFPHLPSTESRTSLFTLCEDIANFRNRISHHEPLLKSDVTAMFSDIMKLLAWLCPDTEKWVRPHCEVLTVIRSRP